jgi:hypothetical protein
VAVPGSPIPADAPIIGETPKPSRASSFVSLLNMAAGSRAPSRSQTPQLLPQDYAYRSGSPMMNGMYSSAPTTPLPNGAGADLSTSSSSQSVHEQQYGYSRAHHHLNGHYPNCSISSTSTASGAATSPGRSKPMPRRLSNRTAGRDRPQLEVDTSDLEGKRR